MIKGDMYVEDIVSEFPSAVSFLMDRDIICIKCGAPVWGTLSELLASKEISDPDALIKELNSFVDSQS